MTKTCSKIIALFSMIAVESSYALAQVQGYYDDRVGAEGHIYKLITGGFGSFIIVFMGLGGMASLFITRQDKSQQKAPVLGIVMILIAIFIFAYRTAIKSGIMGPEYIDW